MDWVDAPEQAVPEVLRAVHSAAVKLTAGAEKKEKPFIISERPLVHDPVVRCIHTPSMNIDLNFIFQIITLESARRPFPTDRG